MKWILLLSIAFIAGCGDCKLGKDYRTSFIKDGRAFTVECKDASKTPCGWELYNCHNGKVYNCVKEVEIGDACRAPSFK